MSKSIRLTPRDRQVFEHLKQFEFTTKTVLWHSFFKNHSRAAVESLLRRLDQRGIGYLYGRKIPGTRTLYYQLTELGARELGHKFDPKLPSITKIFKLLATLHFINCGPKELKRTYLDKTKITRFIDCEELRAGKIRPPRVDFYVAQNRMETKTDSSLVLGGILPDLNTTVERVAQRCVKHSQNLIKRGWFVDTMRSGRFEWTILTGHQQKQAELKKYVPRVLQQRMAMLYFKHRLNSGKMPPIQIKVEVIPEIGPIRLHQKKKDKDK